MSVTEIHGFVIVDPPVPVAAVLKSQKDEEQAATFQPLPGTEQPLRDHN